MQYKIWSQIPVEKNIFKFGFLRNFFCHNNQVTNLKLGQNYSNFLGQKLFLNQNSCVKKFSLKKNVGQEKLWFKKYSWVKFLGKKIQLGMAETVISPGTVVCPIMFQDYTTETPIATPMSSTQLNLNELGNFKGSWHGSLHCLRKKKKFFLNPQYFLTSNSL